MKTNNKIMLIPRIILVIFAFIFSFIPAFAIDPDTLKFYSKNNILYYDPNGANSGCVEGSSISVFSGDLPEETMQKLESAKIKERAEKNMERYLYAQKETGLPWQILAALHWREASMDSDKSIANGDKLYDHINVDGVMVYADANKDAKAAAEHFISNAKAVYGVTDFNTLENVANGFLAYNRGYMYKNAGDTWDLSPYVMNYYDKDHWDMKWRHADSCNVKTGKCYNSVEGTTSKSVGALPVFLYLSGDTFVSSSTSSSSSSTSPGTKSADGSNVTIIGDSITYITHTGYNAFSDKLPSADISAQGSRTFQTGIDIIKDPSNESSYHHEKYSTPHTSTLSSSLRQNVVFALGSNETTVSESQINDVISTLGSERNIYFITNYVVPGSSYGGNDYTSNNQRFKEAAEKNSNVYLIDWASEASANHDKYISDGIHPTKEGAEVFASMIYNAVNKSTNTSICDGSSSSSPWTGDFPFYNQCDPKWGTLEYGPNGIAGGSGYTDICASGCGPSSFAMMATKLLGREILPSETADIAGKAGMHIKGNGSSWDITRTLIANGGYELDYEELSWSGTTEQKIALINQKLQDGWMIHTSGSGSSPFTSGGHYIGIRGLTSSGKWLIADSNGRTNTGNPGEENTLNREWEPSDVVVNMKHAKAIKKK